MKNQNTNNTQSLFVLQHVTFRSVLRHSYWDGVSKDNRAVAETEIVGVYSSKEKAIEAMKIKEMEWENTHDYCRKENPRIAPPTDEELLRHYDYCCKYDPKMKPATLRRAFGLWYKDWQIVEKHLDE